jgi:hypothetical protein
MFLKSGVVVVQSANREILGFTLLEVGKSD